MWVKELSMAIIKQACEDYRTWTDVIRRSGERKSMSKSQRKTYDEAVRGIPELESFFLSDWFTDLSFGNLDGEALLAELKREVKAQEEKNIA